jgi:hypothetical protein
MGMCCVLFCDRSAWSTHPGRYLSRSITTTRWHGWSRSTYSSKKHQWEILAKSLLRICPCIIIFNTYVVRSRYGPVKDYIYSIAAAQYFGPHAQDAKGEQQKFNYSTATVPEVIEAFIDGADANVEMTIGFVKFAKALGVKTAGYESGPGYAVGGLKPGTKALNTLITAARDPGEQL